MRRPRQRFSQLLTHQPRSRSLHTNRLRHQQQQQGAVVAPKALCSAAQR
jgi:hypothetical protein